MTTPLSTPLARISSRAGGVCGAGFVLGNRHVITCAHVIDDALERPRGSADKPTELVKLDLPFLRRFDLEAHVVEWRPMRPIGDLERDPVADIAVIELPEEVTGGVDSRRVKIAPPVEGSGFKTYGYPAGLDNGTMASGELLIEDSGGWRQVRDQQDLGYFIEPGFSGAPLFDARDLALIGMFVAADADPGRRLAFAVPSLTLAQAWPLLAKPYKELFAFEEEDSVLFFGREAFVDELLNKIRKLPFLTVIGPSGTGKSSVLMAGLAPRLRATGTWSIIRCRPGHGPLYSLARAVTRLLAPDDVSDLELANEAEALESRLRTDPSFLLERVRAVRDVAPGIEHLLIVIDQFEELFTLQETAHGGPGGDEIEQQAWTQGKERQREFVGVLRVIASQRMEPEPLIQAVATMRADFMGAALQVEGLDALLRDADVKLGPMAPSDLAAAIERPAARFGVHFESGLVPEIVASMVGSAGGLPLMQFALDQLWRLQCNRMLSSEAYRSIGGVEGALAAYADEKFEGLSEVDQIRAQRVFMRLVRLPMSEHGGYDTRAIVDRTRIGEADWAIVLMLAEARLVTTGRDPETNAETAELVHESLIRFWPRLQSWIGQARSELRLSQRMAEAAERWKRFDEDPDLLWRGADLARLDADRAALEQILPLSPAQTAFADASIRQAESVLRRRRALRLAALAFTLALIALTITIARNNYLQWVEKRAWGELDNLDSGKRHKLFNRTDTVGREVSSNEGLIDVPMHIRSVSRSHLRLSRTQRVLDLRSTLGTTLNGRQLFYSMAADFHDGDIFVLGGQTPARFRAYRYAWYEWLPYLERKRTGPSPACGWGIIVAEIGGKARYRYLSQQKVGIRLDKTGIVLLDYDDPVSMVSLRLMYDDPKLEFDNRERAVSFAFLGNGDFTYSQAIQEINKGYGRKVERWPFYGATIRIRKTAAIVNAEFRTDAYHLGSYPPPRGVEIVGVFSRVAAEARHAFLDTDFMSFVFGDDRLQVVPFIRDVKHPACPPAATARSN